MQQISFGKRKIALPRSRVARVIIGVVLVVGGVVGFLPVLGFWMVPLGLLVLSIDLPVVRRWRRALSVRVGRWMKRRYPGLWRYVGNGNGAADAPQPAPRKDRRNLL